MESTGQFVIVDIDRHLVVAEAPTFVRACVLQRRMQRETHRSYRIDLAGRTR